MSRMMVLCALLLITVAAAPVLAGDHPHGRDGFVIGFNAGGGQGQVHLDTGEEDDAGGGAGQFRLGWAFADEFMISLESAAWVNNDTASEVTLASNLLGLTWYPGATGFFLRTGFGAGQIDITFDMLGGDLTVSDGGGSFGVGAGHEWRLGEKFALGGALDYRTFSVDGGDFDFTIFTVQLNWYF